MNKTILALIIAVALFGCEEKEKEVWKGYISPGPDQEFFVNDYKSLDRCRETAEWKLKAMQIKGSGTYECRKNCAEDASGRQVCEETYKGE